MSFAATIGLQVVAIDHDQTATGSGQGGKGEAPGNIRHICLPRRPPGSVAFQLGGNPDLLRANLACEGIGERADDMNGESRDNGAELVKGIPVGEFHTDEDVRIQQFQRLLPRLHVGVSLSRRGGGAFAGKPFHVPGNDLKRVGISLRR